MGRKVAEALIAITIIVAIIGLMTVMATGCGVLDDFGDFGGDDGDGNTQTPSKRPPPTIQPFNPSKKRV